MVVLAVTWMAKAGRDAEVAALFSKLTEESRKESGCAMFQVHRHRTEPHVRPRDPVSERYRRRQPVAVPISRFAVANAAAAARVMA